ncbi:MAG: DEAD/DEAH box helicase [Deltaproteobacteria bacterium]|nr:DEAD/DEAH box helicase [Deltaproteobacteria bacterium]
MTPDGNGLRVEALLRPLAEGALFVPGEGPARASAVREGKRGFTLRDPGEEKARAGRILASLPLGGSGQEKGWVFDIADAEQALDLVAYLERGDASTEVVVEWPEKKLERPTLGGPKDLRVRVDRLSDWFGLSGGLEVDGQRVELALLLDAVRGSKRYVPVSGGRWLAISQELRGLLSGLADVAIENRAGELEMGLGGMLTLADLAPEMGEFLACEEWSAQMARMRNALRVEPEVPPELKATLRPYQLEGFKWLSRMAAWGMGTCLADDMGLGKTVQALAVLSARAQQGPALVVAPTSVCFNWVREAQRFTPGLSLHLFHEVEREAVVAALGPGQVLVISWGLLARNIEMLRRVRFATAVLDEAQAIKNPSTQRAKAVREIQAEWRVALSGTPIENHLGELWSLMRTVAPGLLGSWEHFRDRFATPIERDRDASRGAALARLVRPFILRRTKSEVEADLPSRTEVRNLIKLSPAERRLYEDARVAALAKLEGFADPSEKRFQVLASLTHLRLLACHPRLDDGESNVASSKLERLLELVEELRANGHRALVFSQFTRHLALVREALEARSVSYLYLDGSVPQAERAKRVDAFQAGEADLFLISLKAGGTGLNLTAADYVLHLDPWWNPAVEDQATDRAHRIGQTRPVTVYRLISRGTIEEAIVALHEQKRELAEAILEGSGAAGRLSTEELVDLIRAGEGSLEEDEEDAVEDA